MNLLLRQARENHITQGANDRDPRRLHFYNSAEVSLPGILSCMVPVIFADRLIHIGYPRQEQKKLAREITFAPESQNMVPVIANREATVFIETLSGFASLDGIKSTNSIVNIQPKKSSGNR